MNTHTTLPPFSFHEGPHLCISVQAGDQKTLLQRMERAQQMASIVEVRLDGVRDLNLAEVFVHKKGSLILTCRPSSHGASALVGDVDRVALLLDGARMGAEVIDLELETAEEGGGEELVCAFQKKKAKVIVSYHNFSETPKNLREILGRVLACRPDGVKLATHAGSWQDNLSLLALPSRLPLPVTAFGLGEKGRVSRILGRKFGSFLSYASLEQGEETGPGQISFDQFRDPYRWEEINGETELFGILGTQLSHSLSPLIHNTLFQLAGENKVYLPFPAEDLDDFIRFFRKAGGKGLSVTHPHKESIARYLDEPGMEAGEGLAFNTLVIEEERTRGFNTDGPACAAALAAFLDGKDLSSACSYSKNRSQIRERFLGMSIFILGAGGAAKAAAREFKRCGANLTLFNRTPSKGKEAAQELGVKWGGEKIPGGAQPHILIQATPVGMKPNVKALPLDPSVLSKGTVVYDLIYNPAKTKFLSEAEKKGNRILSGIGMLILQALLQYRIFTRREPEEGWLEGLSKSCRTFLHEEKR